MVFNVFLIALFTILLFEYLILLSLNWIIYIFLGVSFNKIAAASSLETTVAIDGEATAAEVADTFLPDG